MRLTEHCVVPTGKNKRIPMVAHSKDTAFFAYILIYFGNLKAKSFGAT